MEQKNQIKGAIYGLLVGDAVGVPYEFNLPEKLPNYDQIDMISPESFQKHIHKYLLVHGLMMELRHYVY